MNITVTRTYEDASFLINRGTGRSAFFEGPLAILAPRFLDNPKYTIPDSFLNQFRPEDRGRILADAAEVKQTVSALAKPSVGNKFSADKSLSVKSALEELSGYAIRNWQPVNVSIELTYLCNQRCKWCYLNDFRARGMSRKRINEIAEELKEAGIVFILLTGGEVFLRSDALDVMEDLEEKGFVIEIKTNGTVFKPRAIERLIRLHPIDIQVSIYSINDGYSKLTGSHYHFCHIQENIKALLDGKLPVTLSVLVGKHNINEIEKIHEVLMKMGAEIFYSPYITPNRGGAGKEVNFRLSRRELEEKLRPFLEKTGILPTPRKYRSCERESDVCFAGRDQISSIRLVAYIPVLIFDYHWANFLVNL